MIDPYRVLGVDLTASDEAIRAAYLAAIRESPPERDRERFESVREAYEAISNQRRRLAHELFDYSRADRRRCAERHQQRFCAAAPDRAAAAAGIGGEMNQPRMFLDAEERERLVDEFRACSRARCKPR
jgi:DnaJ-class molecular chaperone